MGLIRIILFTWLVFFRFIVFSDSILIDSISLIMAIGLLKIKKSLFAYIAIVVNLQMFYVSLLPFLNIDVGIALISALGAIITLLLTYTPFNYGRNFR